MTIAPSDWGPQQSACREMPADSASKERDYVPGAHEIRTLQVGALQASQSMAVVAVRVLWLPTRVRMVVRLRSLARVVYL